MEWAGKGGNEGRERREEWEEGGREGRSLPTNKILLQRRDELCSITNSGCFVVVIWTLMSFT